MWTRPTDPRCNMLETLEIQEKIYVINQIKSVRSKFPSRFNPSANFLIKSLKGKRKQLRQVLSRKFTGKSKIQHSEPQVMTSVHFLKWHIEEIGYISLVAHIPESTTEHYIPGKNDLFHYLRHRYGFNSFKLG